MLVAFTAFPFQDPRMLVMFLLAGPVPALVAFPLARFFASRAGEVDAGAHAAAVSPTRGSE